MATALLLHVGNDATLLAPRTSTLSAKWNVVTATIKNAWRTFLDNDFDLVLICRSVLAADRLWLVRQIASRSPSAAILIVSSDSVLAVEPPAIVVSNDSESLVITIEKILQDHRWPNRASSPPASTQRRLAATKR